MKSYFRFIVTGNFSCYHSITAFLFYFRSHLHCGS